MLSRHRPLIAVSLVALLFAVGCGSDDDSAADGTTTTTSGDNGDVTEYCTAVTKIETTPDPDIDFEKASPEEIATGIKAYATDLLPTAHQVQDAAPEEIADAVGVQVGALEKLASTGDFDSTLGSPEAAAAEKTEHAYDLDNCDWGATKATASEYAFAGLKKTYDAGIVSFDLTNGGKEVHELGLIRKNDGTKQSWDELLAMDEGAADDLATVVGFVEPTQPGESGYKVVDLKAGEYVAVCFLPVGATPEVFAAAEKGGAPPDGPPHFTKGMRVEFTVD
jgi:hypothetical protein